MKNRSTETPAFSPFSNGFRFRFVQICKYSIYIRWFFSMLKCGQRTLNKNYLNSYSNRRMARKKILSIKIRRNVKNWSETNVKVSNEPLKIELRIFVLKKNVVEVFFGKKCQMHSPHWELVIHSTHHLKSC